MENKTTKYLVLYIETCGTEYIKKEMTGQQLGELLSDLDYEVHTWKEIKEEK